MTDMTGSWSSPKRLYLVAYNGIYWKTVVISTVMK